jgi:pyrimidine 5'-nucleotidase
LSKYSLLLFDLDDTLLSSSWFNVGLIQTLGMHPITRTLDASIFLEKKLHVPKSLLEQFKHRELTPLEFRRARWRHAFAYFNVLPDVDLIDVLDALFLKTGIGCIGLNNSVTSL